MALTEQELRDSIINKVIGLSTEKLRKINEIIDSILTPLDTELTSVDFSGMLLQVFKDGGLADLYFPEWTDRSESDFGRFLVELFAIFSDKDFFYMNHYSKEGFLGVAEEYRSIFHKAFQQGFNPPSNVSATGDIELLFGAGSAEVVPRGAISIGVSEMPSLVYTNEQFTMPTSTIDTSVTVQFKHGKVKQESGKFDGYSIFIDTKGISDGSIRLFIGSDEWEQTDNFLKGTTATKHFMVVFTESGKAEILFASGKLGAVPAVDQSYTVEYIVGGGYIGDIEENVLNLVLENGTNRRLVSFTQFQMIGGNNLMPMELLRQTTIGKQRHQNRAVTPEDVDYLCKELSFVKKVKTEAFLNFVYVYVLPTSGGVLDNTQINLIEEKINSVDDEERKLLLGFNLSVTSAVFVPLKIIADIYLLPDTIKSSAMIKATQTLQEILDPLKDASFGDGFNRSKNASKILQRVSGATNVVFSTLHRVGVPAEAQDMTFIRREITDFNNSEITINLIGGI